MRTALPFCGMTFRSATVLPLQKNFWLKIFLSTLLILQNAGQDDDDDEVSNVSTEIHLVL